VGIKGLFVAIMIMGLVAGDSGHLHSWGSIFVQDVVLPLKKKAMSPRQHIWALRLAVMGVAGFALFFSLVWTQTQYINLYWAITGGIFTGGAGAVIIGGLYWRRGTTTAAWAATLTGSILAFGGMIVGSFWPGIVGFVGPTFEEWGLLLPEKFWFNFQVSSFLAAIAAVAVYIATSLLTSRQPFNLDRMLHRGQYAVEAKSDKQTGVLPLRERIKPSNLLHFDTNFTFRDKLVARGIFWWSMLLVAVNIVVSLWNLVLPRFGFGGMWPMNWWAHYWMITGIAVPLVIAFATLIWFGIGGWVDMKAFFIALRTQTRDARDDGRVVDHHNLADEPPRPQGIEAAPEPNAPPHAPVVAGPKTL
jgi:SSS family solute:Na+ symporter